MTQDKRTLPLELSAPQVAWLEQRARAHGLPDASKALRCVLAFAMQRCELDEAIFEVIRCARPDACDGAQQPASEG